MFKRIPLYRAYGVRRMTELTNDDIQEAYKKMAIIVSLHGEKYLPLFNRMHQLVQARKADCALLVIAQKLAMEAKIG